MRLLNSQGLCYCFSGLCNQFCSFSGANIVSELICRTQNHKVSCRVWDVAQYLKKQVWTLNGQKWIQLNHYCPLKLHDIFLWKPLACVSSNDAQFFLCIRCRLVYTLACKLISFGLCLKWCIIIWDINLTAAGMLLVWSRLHFNQSEIWNKRS